MTTAFTIIIIVSFLAPWFIWTGLKWDKKMNGLKVWHKKAILFSFLFCWIICLVFGICLIVLLI